MTNVATYKNVGIDVSEDMQYLAYVVLPSGDYWHVRFNGATEEEAKARAISRWTKENAKWERLGLNRQEPPSDHIVGLAEALKANEVDPWLDNVAPSGRGKHFAGKRIYY